LSEIWSMSVGLKVKYQLLLSDFNENRIFSTDFWKMFKYEISWKSVQGSRVVPCGQTDGWTDMTKTIVAFRNFANAPKIRDPDSHVPVIQRKLEPSSNLVMLTVCWKLTPIFKVTMIYFTWGRSHHSDPYDSLYYQYAFCFGRGGCVYGASQRQIAWPQNRHNVNFSSRTVFTSRHPQIWERF
jgi:hypothetical protein